MSFNPKDHYFKKAKQENYLARSAFKLEEIDQRLKIIRPGQLIIDLGCAPGSWAQYALRKIQNGNVVGIDLKEVTLKHPQFHFLQKDILQYDIGELLKEKGFPPIVDVVLSDMAPNTTGIRNVDQARSMELCEMALTVATKYLKPKGHFICKLFHSEDFAKLQSAMKAKFEKFEAMKPDSTRKISKEIFLIGLSKK